MVIDMERRFIASKVLFAAIREQLAADRQAEFVVTGMSMWPLLCHGRDSVVVEKLRPEEIQMGDILLFEAAPEKYILHRVTRLFPDAFETTGDGNCFRDGIFPRECAVARVTELVRKGKHIPCAKFGVRIYVKLWTSLFPMRKRIFAVWNRLRPIFRRNKRADGAR